MLQHTTAAATAAVAKWTLNWFNLLLKEDNKGERTMSISLTRLVHGKDIFCDFWRLIQDTIPDLSGKNPDYVIYVRQTLIFSLRFLD
jgi:hypothetical protein